MLHKPYLPKMNDNLLKSEADCLYGLGNLMHIPASSSYSWPCMFCLHDLSSAS